MEPGKIIKTFEDFFEKHYRQEILEVIQKGLKNLIIDFRKLAQFNIEISDLETL